jgi:hypothetical protein
MDQNESTKQVLKFIEHQTTLAAEFVARLDALQDYLASRDPQFWDEWPTRLAAARGKIDNPFDWMRPSTSGQS